MLCYRLRTLLIILEFGPLVMTGVWFLAATVAAEFRLRHGADLLQHYGGGVTKVEYPYWIDVQRLSGD
jgi:ABC-type thiamin/hydroxymethylpyrimidine transport system permease subunit